MRLFLLGVFLSLVHFIHAQNIQPFVVDTGVNLKPTFIEYYSDSLIFIGGYTIERASTIPGSSLNERAYLFRSVDAGNSWQRVWRGVSITYQVSRPFNITRLDNGDLMMAYAGQLYYHIVYSQDNGSTWQQNPNVFTSDSSFIYIEDITSVGNTSVACGFSSLVQDSGAFFIATSNDLGDTWQKEMFLPVGIFSRDRFDRSNTGKLYFGYNERRYEPLPPPSTGSTLIWKDKVGTIDLNTGDIEWLLDEPLCGFLDLEMITDDLGFVIGTNGVFKTANGGDTWDREITPFSSTFVADRIFYHERSGDVLVIGRDVYSWDERDVVLYKGGSNGLFWTEVFREPTDSVADEYYWENQTFAITSDGSVLVGMPDGRFFRIDNVVGVEEADLSAQLQVYPNPASTNINVTFPATTSATVDLYDVTGQKMLTHSINGLNKTSVDISGVSSGVYILQVKLDNGATTSRKVVVE